MVLRNCRQRFLIPISLSLAATGLLDRAVRKAAALSGWARCRLAVGRWWPLSSAFATPTRLATFDGGDSDEDCSSGAGSDRDTAGTGNNAEFVSQGDAYCYGHATAIRAAASSTASIRAAASGTIENRQRAAPGTFGS